MRRELALCLLALGCRPARYEVTHPAPPAPGVTLTGGTPTPLPPPPGGTPTPLPPPPAPLPSNPVNPGQGPANPGQGPANPGQQNPLPPAPAPQPTPCPCAPTLSVCSLDDLPVCSDLKENFVVYVRQLELDYICRQGMWIPMEVVQ